MKATPEEIARRFEALADYLSDVERGQKAIIDAPLALRLVAESAAATVPGASQILDIGCGAGNYSLKLLQFLPGADVTLVDLSSALLGRAVERVETVAAGNVTAVQGDIRSVDLGSDRFDIVVAGAVLHHLREEEEWDSVFRSVFQALRPGGGFWISDLIDHADPAIQRIMTERYSDYLVEIGNEEGRDRVFAEIAEQDSPRPLLFQVDLMREVGFADVEILHKNSCFATFAGFKRA